MIGAIAGDMLGSPYEGHPTKDKGFKLFRDRGRPTDDTVLSLAVTGALLDADADTQACVAGAIAEAHYDGVPAQIAARVLPRLEEGLFATLERFAARWLPEGQRVLVEREREGRTLDAFRPSVFARRKAPGGRDRRLAERPRPGHRVLVAPETLERLSAYASRLTSDPSIAGARLRGVLESGRFRNPGRFDAEGLLDALFRTRKPRIFAESEVAGDGSDWNADELGLLGDAGVAVPVVAFDDGRHANPRVHGTPFGATLLFSAGALLRSDRGRAADADHVVDGAVDRARYAAVYERRLLPLLRFAVADARARGRTAFVTLPGLGCGQFAGAFRGTLGPLLRDALALILERHAASLDGLRALRFDPYDECADARLEFGAVSFLVRPLVRSVNPLPQLRPPRDYEEPGDDFSGCDLYSVVAWDHVSWPGNDFWTGSRATDDGVKAAATDAMFVLSGFRGRYDAGAAAYLPPEGVGRWEGLVRRHGLSFGAAGWLAVAR